MRDAFATWERVRCEGGEPVGLSVRAAEATTPLEVGPEDQEPNESVIVYFSGARWSALELDPSQAVEAMERQIIGFAMPGEGIPDFNTHAKAIAAAGIYDLHAHYEQILEPIVLRFWDLPNLTGLTGEAEASRERTIAYIEKSKRVADRIKERREARERKLASVV